ncbi:hypothetical protein SteCoe_5027 [Stentor coeruleus]|uniref:RING-type domain-containing protein n=1 Tax=Stentor coeruleus TaxID=5963 RepID=A0A1R2CTC1_9CILI|nr:hypothetical protein SteCoe_5027 [Stentor coeruleus]
MDSEEYLEIKPTITGPKGHNKRIIDTGVLSTNPIHKIIPGKEKSISNPTDKSLVSESKSSEQVPEPFRVKPLDIQEKDNPIGPKIISTGLESAKSQDVSSQKKPEDHDKIHKDFSPIIPDKSSQNKTDNLTGPQSKMPGFVAPQSGSNIKSPFLIGENKGSNPPFAPFQAPRQEPILNPNPQQTGILNNSKPVFQPGPKGPDDLQNKPKVEIPFTSQQTFTPNAPFLKPQPMKSEEKTDTNLKSEVPVPNIIGKTGQGIAGPSFQSAKSSEETKKSFPAFQPISSTKPNDPFAKFNPTVLNPNLPNPQNPIKSQSQGPKPFSIPSNPIGLQSGPLKTSETVEKKPTNLSEIPKNPSIPIILQNQQPKQGPFISNPASTPFIPSKNQELKPSPVINNPINLPFGYTKTSETTEKPIIIPTKPSEISSSKTPVPESQFPAPKNPVPFISNSTQINLSKTQEQKPLPPNFIPKKISESTENPPIVPTKPLNIFSPKNPNLENPFPGQTQQPKQEPFISNPISNPFNTSKPQEIKETTTPGPINKPDFFLNKTTPKENPGPSQFLPQTQLKSPSAIFTPQNQQGLPFGKPNSDIKNPPDLFSSKPSDETQLKNTPLQFKGPNIFNPSQIPNNNPNLPGFLNKTNQTVTPNPPFKIPINPNQKSATETLKIPEDGIIKSTPQENQNFISKNQSQIPFNLIPQGLKPGSVSSDATTKPFIPIKTPENIIKPFQKNDKTPIGNESINPFGGGNKDTDTKTQIPLNLIKQVSKNEDTVSGSSGFPFLVGKNTETSKNIDLNKTKVPENEVGEISNENIVPKEVKDTIKVPQIPFGQQPQGFKPGTGFPPSNFPGLIKVPEPNQKPLPNFVGPSGTEISDKLPGSNPDASKPQNQTKVQFPINPTSQKNILGQNFTPDNPEKNIVKDPPFIQVPKDLSLKPQFPINPQSQTFIPKPNPVIPFITTKNPEPIQKSFINTLKPSDQDFPKDPKVEISGIPKLENKDQKVEISGIPKLETKDPFKINPSIAMQSQTPKLTTTFNNESINIKSTPPQNTNQGVFPGFIKKNEEDTSKTQPIEKSSGFAPSQQSKPDIKAFIPQVSKSDQSSKEFNKIPISEPGKNFEPDHKTIEGKTVKIPEQEIKPENPMPNFNQIPISKPQNPLPPTLAPNPKSSISLTPQFPSEPASSQFPELKFQPVPLNPQKPSFNTSQIPLQNPQKVPQNPNPTQPPLKAPNLANIEKPIFEPKKHSQSTSSNFIRHNPITQVQCKTPIAIPSIKKLPKKINQDSIPDKLNFISILLTIINPEKSPQVKDQIFALCPNIKDEYPDIYDLIIKKLSSVCFCNLCQNGQSDFEFKCGHKFCEQCATYKLINLTPKISIPTLGCPICYNPVSYQNLERIFPKNQHDLRYDLESRLVKEALEKANVQCKKCAKDRGFDMFISESCMHMCKECIATSIRWQVLTCEYCDYPFQAIEDLRNNTITCDGCKHKVYYIGDYVKKINDGHFLCSECLKNTLKTSSCAYCSKSLTHQEIIEIDNFLFDYCAKCGNEYGITSFKILQCCKNHICDDCFYKIGPCSLCINTI